MRPEAPELGTTRAPPNLLSWATAPHVCTRRTFLCPRVTRRTTAPNHVVRNVMPRSGSRHPVRLRTATRAFAATVAVALAALAVGASVEPANAATQNPVGAFDTASGGAGAVTVAGWTDDPSSAASSNSVTVTVGGTNAGTLRATGVRADVDRARHVSGNHGFSGTLTTAKTGAQSVCVTAVNTGAGTDTNLGCKTVTITAANPVGAFDTASGGTGTVGVAGWTYDPSSAAASNSVTVTVGGVAVGTLQATGARADVDRAKHVSGHHGYSGSLTTSKSGAQSVCVTAVNTGAGSNTALGCKTVTITATGTAPAPVSGANVTTSPSGVAMPKGDVTSNGRVWKQAYAQDFTTPAAVGTVLSTYHDLSAYDGSRDTSGLGQYAPNKVLSVSGGELDFDLHSENGQPLVSTVVPDNYLPLTTGRVSVRYKTTKTPGYKFVGILWPEDDNWNEGEIDWPEADLGGTPRPASAIPGTYANGRMNFAPAVTKYAGSDTTGWHTATTEWDHGVVRFSWDGTLVDSVTNAVPTTAFRLTLQAETWIGEGAVPATATGHVDVDWVSIWK
ncbi:hypothetical protein DEI86_00035 [Curtobacterium sp. MCBD17_028]|nr:hypothetical protein DEI86_00035 [Curtobacterium sp. MCBD17_028]